VAVIRYLQRARYPFLLAVPCKGRKADHPNGPGGTRVFHLRRRSSWGKYTHPSEGRLLSRSLFSFQAGGRSRRAVVSCSGVS
jgi:hypothetical protein